MRFKLSIWVLALLTILIWVVILQLPDGNLHIVTCDVGQGDATYIRTPGGKDVLVDVGRGSAVVDCLGEYMPFYDRTIEMLILTHGDKDHVGGLRPLLIHYDVDLMVGNDDKNLVIPTNVEGSRDPSTPPLRALLRMTKEDSGQAGVTEVTTVVAGDRFVIDDVAFVILWPEKETMRLYREMGREEDQNATSIVVRMQYDDLSALFTADVDANILDVINDRFGLDRAFFLKVPHHGSRFGLSAGIVAVIQPMVATISVGKNSYGHPHSSIIGLLESSGSNVYRTDQSGHIEFISDGERWSVRTER